jgi:Family of unknown function (DUF6496)
MFTAALCLRDKRPYTNDMPTKKSSGTGKKKVHKVMSEYKQGDLQSSAGGKVKSRKQAVAIALSEARSAGAKIPKKKAPAAKKKTAPTTKTKTATKAKKTKS